MTSWVEIDPERAPLIRWAFEVYATGDWTVTDLHLALRQKGLTTRPTANKPARDLPLNSLYKLLRNPYYLGVVTYQGATYEGKHDALIDTELWLHVQDILAAHAHAGEKDRVHQHYLRGTIFCGQCGARLVFSRNQGNGGYYDYFVCTKKRTRSHNCPRPAIRLEKIEQGIAVFYSRFQLTPTATADIRLGVRADMAAEIADAHQTRRTRPTTPGNAARRTRPAAASPLRQRRAPGPAQDRDGPADPRHDRRRARDQDRQRRPRQQRANPRRRPDRRRQLPPALRSRTRLHQAADQPGLLPEADHQHRRHRDAG
ncbi:MAG: recombinase family protein [Nocardioidaceae bacterium]